MVKFTIYTGGYTSFIVSYLFDTQTASLTYLKTIDTSANPSWLAPHPTNPSIIYATNENPVGALQSYATSPGGGLVLLDEVSSGGNGPAFCWPLSTGQVAIMNYGSGNGEIIPTVAGGKKFDNSTSVLLTFPPPPGGVSNPHMAYQYGKEVFVPDLGGDKLWRIGQTGAPGWAHSAPERQRPAPHGYNSIYVLHETANLLTKQAVPSYPNGTAPFLASVSTLPDDLPTNTTYAAAELIIPPVSAAYPRPYLYASNRNIGTVPDPRGDSIAIFEPDRLALVAQVFTGLVQIRGMALGVGGVGGVGNVGEEYVVAMGARTDGGRALEEVARNSSAVPRTSAVMRVLGGGY
ncbi:Lactonase, 7-bladed beta-propeller-domain-containing protein [Mycena polygramma]|nr:Lactonase, 7-bladed beta-propeller-domain-containing protein [Mycena polygramma]